MLGMIKTGSSISPSDVRICTLDLARVRVPTHSALNVASEMVSYPETTIPNFRARLSVIKLL